VQLILSLHGAHSSAAEDVDWDILLSHDDKMLERSVPRRSAHTQLQLAPFSFVTGESLDGSEMAQLWDGIALTSEEDSVVQALHTIDQAINRIAFLSAGFLGNPSLYTIVVMLDGLEQRLPLASLGDGVRRVLALCLAEIEARHGYLLVDEIDTGLHYSAMTRMWETVIETANRLDVQVFATTHSQDCIRSLAHLREDKPELCDAVRLHRIENGQVKTIVYGPEELPVIEREHIEVR